MNKVISASAGTGKTYQITQEIIRLLKQGVSIDEILALTFTDKAAAEMKERVFKALREAADNAQTRAEKELFRRQKEAFSQNYISTFHSFCRRSISYFPEELAQIPILLKDHKPQYLISGFTMLDEHTEQLRNMEWFRAFLHHFKDLDALQILMGTESPTKIKNLLNSIEKLDEGSVRRCAELSAEDFLQLIEETKRRIQSQFELSWDKLFHISAFWDLFKKDPRSEEFSYETLLPMLNKGGDIGKTHVDVEKGSEEEHFFKAINEEYLKPLLWQFQSLGHLEKWLDTSSESLLQHLRQTLSSDEPVDAISSTYRSIRVSSEVASLWMDWKRYHRVKAGTLNFDDLIWFSVQLLKSESGGQSVDILRNKFRFILVDEFQDTDQNQWEVVKALSDNFSRENVIVVGDMKQAIYGFRGGEVALMQSLLNDHLRFTTSTLGESYRSGREVVNFTNDLGKLLFPDNGAAYDPEYQNVKTTNIGEKKGTGRVRIVRADPLLEDIWDDEVSDRAKHWQELRNGSEVEAEWIADYVHKLLFDESMAEEPRHLREEYAEKKTAVGLLCAQKSKMGIFLDALRKRGISAAITGGKGFFQSREFIDTYFLLAALADVKDEVAVVGMLRSPWFGLSDQALYKLKKLFQKNDSFLSVISSERREEIDLLPEDRFILRSRSPWFAELRSMVRNQPLSECLEYAFSGSSPYWLTDSFDQPRMNIHKLLSKIRDFEEEGNGSLFEIVEIFKRQMLDETPDSEASLDELPAVQIMTIHASKGLAFPAVILADVGSRGNNHSISLSPLDDGFRDPKTGEHSLRLFGSNILETQRLNSEDSESVLSSFLKQVHKEREEAELRRKLYVAITRPETHLIITDISSTFLTSRANNAGFRPYLMRPELAGYEELLQLEDFEHLAQMSEVEPQIKEEQSPSREALQVYESKKEHLQSIRTKAQRKTLRPSGFAEENDHEPEPDESGEFKSYWKVLDAAQAGTLLHGLFQAKLSNYNRSPDLLNYAFELGADISKAELEHDLSEIRRQFELGWMQLAPLLENAMEIRSEQTFFAEIEWKGQPQFMRGTIDLIFRNHLGEWHIIDFKTTRVDADSAIEISRKEGYGDQLIAYKQAAEKITGISIKPEHVRLLFTSSESAIWVSLEQLLKP